MIEQRVLITPPPAVVTFEPWPKIARLNRGCLITEKLDGTNAQVHVLEDGRVLAGSRTRYVTPEKDNFGFAAWVAAHEDELRTLGPGRHYGEWWGQGIQRTYGLTEKRFSLFNATRWNPTGAREALGALPACCGVVPVLYTGNFSSDAVAVAVERLRVEGSVAAPGFMRPEGVVVYLSAAGTSFKVTLENDEQPKGRPVP